MHQHHRPSPTHDTVTALILPPHLHKDVLIPNHDAATTSHFGGDKTLERLRQVAFLINVAEDVAEYCR